MRRRQVYAAQTAAREAALSSLGGVIAEAPAPQPAENACPKCGRVFKDGRGKLAHVKACKA